jgi:hypothetical protein
MNESLGESSLRHALEVLGRRLFQPTALVLGGAGALILTGELSRTTADCDVLFANPDMGQLQRDIAAVAEQLNLGGGWLNGSIQTYLDIVPPDFRSRLRSLPVQGRLSIAVLHRQDILVMKLFAGRPSDLQDITTLSPTSQELSFARSELPRLARIDARRATDMGSTIAAFEHGA